MCIGPFLGQLETYSIPLDRQWIKLKNVSEIVDRFHNEDGGISESEP